MAAPLAECLKVGRWGGAQHGFAWFAHRLNKISSVDSAQNAKRRQENCHACGETCRRCLIYLRGNPFYFTTEFFDSATEYFYFTAEFHGFAMPFCGIAVASPVFAVESAVRKADRQSCRRLWRREPRGRGCPWRQVQGQQRARPGMLRRVRWGLPRCGPLSMRGWN